MHVIIDNMPNHNFMLPKRRFGKAERTFSECLFEALFNLS